MVFWYVAYNFKLFLWTKVLYFLPAFLPLYYFCKQGKLTYNQTLSQDKDH